MHFYIISPRQIQLTAPFVSKNFKWLKCKGKKTNPTICGASLLTTKSTAGSKLAVANLLPVVFVGDNYRHHKITPLNYDIRKPETVQITLYGP